MVLAYFIETQYSPHKATPFNLLPLELAHREFFLELIALLPSSPIDLSFGWVRPRHMLGITPFINFYSRRDINRILEDPQTKLAHKFFLVWKNFSIKLIEESSTKLGPSLVLTTNKQIAEHFRSNETVFSILYQDQEPTEPVYHRCYEQLLRMFTAIEAKTFDDKSVSTELKQGYSLRKIFMPKSQSTASLLCLASETVLAQTRGKLPKILGKEDYPPPDNATCYFRNQQMAEEILAERLVDMILGAKADKSKTSLKKVPMSLDKSANKFLEDFPSMSVEMKKERYLLLREIAIDSLKESHSRSEITLFVPTVNPLCYEFAISELEKEAGTEYKSELRYIIDQVLRGGRQILVDEGKISKGIVEVVKEVANTRIKENAFSTKLVGLFASRRLSPVLKSITAPSSLFDELNNLRQYISSGYLSESKKPSWCRTVGEYFRDIQMKLSKCIPEPYFETIETTGPSYITVVSDLPFEVAQYRGDTAICQTFPTTRLPLTPLGALFHYYNYMSQKFFVGAHMQSLEDVLVLNSLSKEDRLYSEFELFESTCRKIGLNIDAKTVLTSNDFIKNVNSTDAEILVYYGHGSYNTEKDRGELIFRDDKLSHKSFSKLLNIPPIIFLIGCETSSSSAFMGGLASNLLARGAFAILATLFPISADHAGAFLGRILAFSDDLARRNVTNTFSDLVFNARKLGWLKDNLDALEKNGTITLVEEANLMKEVSDELMERSLERGKSLLVHDAIPVFSEILHSYGLLKTWRQIRPRVIPYSLFFSLLGNAQDVFIGAPPKRNTNS